MKWAPIIPLAGGFPLGIEAATNVPPECILSYEAFAKNDAHLISYYEQKGMQIPVHLLDNPVNHRYDLDLVVSTCPCAGTSTQSPNKDITKNDWMFESANFVLGKIKPKIFVGENAPLLFTGGAQDVVKQLEDIADIHGYRMTLYYTNAQKHGISHNRQRCFYFFWKNEGYVLPYFNIIPKYDFRDTIKLANNDIGMNSKLAIYGLEKHFSVRYMKTFGNDWRDLITANGTKTSTMWKWMMKNCMLNDFERWAKLNHDENALKFAEKCKDSDNVFDKTVIAVGKVSPAITSKNMTKIIHPTDDRALTIGECLSIFPMPLDYSLSGNAKNLYHISQNVPTIVAYHVGLMCKDALDGNLESIPTNTPKGIVMQDNIVAKTVLPVEEGSFELF